MDIYERAPGISRSISKQTIKEQICDKLSYMICSGLLRVNDELPSERELAATFNVSRETVRGAIQILATRGMVEVSQGARTRVIRADGYALHEAVSSLRDLKGYTPQAVHEARAVVEVAVVRDAAMRISDDTLARLGALLDAQSLMFNDPVSFQISDREFHQLIYESCSNPLLAKIVGDLYAYALDFRRVAMSQPGAVGRSYQDHRRVYTALAAHDPDAAVAAMTGHLRSVYTTTLEAMERQTP